MPLATGTRLGPYEIQRPLGAGGMGEVYLARDIRLERQVAVKILPPHLAADAARIRRFEQEARAVSALNHPNIVTIYDVGDVGTHRFIAMELIAGRTLRAVASEPLPLDAVVAWGVQIARALTVAHAAGIVHRDIKPENVMVRDDGYVKVLDFGLAQLSVDRTSVSVSLTQPATDPGTVLGSVRYMSPEQARGERVTSATDVFALGTVLYELLTGCHPLTATTLLDLLQALEHQAPLPPVQRLPGLSAELDGLLMKMLDKDARRRPVAADVEQTLVQSSGSVSVGLRTPARASAHASQSTLRDRSLVGREKERDLLRRAFVSACEGQGGLFCVAGEPGIGKTAIVEDFLRELADGPRRCLIAQGRCSERLAGNEAYLPWLEALESLHRADSVESRTQLDGGESPRQVMRRVAPTWSAQVAAADTDDSSAARLLEELRAASQERVKRELATLLETLCASQPLVLFFDDLHWADVSTIDLLGYLSSRLTSLRLLIVATYRPSDLQLAKHPFLTLKLDLQARGLCRDQPLEFLAEDEVEAYLALEYPGHRFPPAFATLIHGRTEGSPLFMADLVRDLRDRGMIAHDGAGWTLASALPDIGRSLPESVRSMIERKVAQLSDDDKRLLVAASVHGYRFESAVVAQALDLDPGDIEERLAALERLHGFVRTVGEAELADRTLTLRCQFVHVLYQGALYVTLTPTRRASLSRRMAEAMLAAHGEPRGAAASELASLYESARDFASAARYFELAAENALRIFAYHEAAALSRRGIAAIQAVPAGAAPAQRELSLYMILGSALMNIRGYGAVEVEESHRIALGLARRLGDTIGIAHGLWGLALCHLLRAEYERTRELATELLAVGRDRREALVAAHYVLGTVLVYLADIAGAQQHFEAGIALCDAPELSALTLPDGRNPAVSCRGQLSRVLWLRGYPDQAVAVSASAHAIASAQAQPVGLAFTLYLDMLLQQLRRNTAAARDRAGQLIALATEHNLAQYRTWAEILHGWAAADSGHADGIEQLQRGLAAQAQMKSDLSRPHFLALLADALCRQGRREEGLSVVAEALSCVDRTGERYYLAEIHRIKGHLLLTGEAGHETAAESFTAALRVAREQRARGLELRAAVSLAGSATDGTARQLARATLREIADGFAEGLDLPDMLDARALLATG